MQLYVGGEYVNARKLDGGSAVDLLTHIFSHRTIVKKLTFKFEPTRDDNFANFENLLLADVRTGYGARVELAYEGAKQFLKISSDAGNFVFV